MRVLHINNYDKKGGAERVFDISRKNNYTINYCGYVKISDTTEFPDISFTSWEKNNIFFGIINYIFSFRNYKLLLNYLSDNKVDIIHIHGFFSSLSPSILLAIKKTKFSKKIKIIQTLHDFHLICPNSSLYNFIKDEICERCINKNIKINIFTVNCDRRGFGFSVIKGIRSILSNNILKHRNIIDKFICPSEFMKRKLIVDGIEEQKISVIRNSVNIYNKELPTKKNIICYFGRFSKEKNLEFLIEVFSYWKNKTPNDFSLLLIGEGEEEVKLRKVANESAYSSSIVFKSFLPFAQLIKIIGEAKYSSMSSKCYENSPMLVIESISLNIIPIVPQLGGMQESVEVLTKIGKTYKFNDKDSWIDALTSLENNYDKIIQNINLTKNQLLNELSVYRYYYSMYNEYQSIQ